VNAQEIEDAILRLREDMQNTHEYVDAHVGQSWGTANPQWPHGAPVFPFREIHTLGRQSINSAFPVTFTVDYDEFIAKLHSAKLRINFHNVRSNVSAATGAAGGGTTVASASGGSSTPTSSSGGGQTPTSSTGGSSNPTSSSDTVYGSGSQTDTSINTGAPSPASTQQESGADPHTHSLNSHTHAIDVTRVTGTGFTIIGFGSSYGLGTNSLGQGSHSHSVFISGHDHTVTIAAHDHTVTIASHTHDVTLVNHTHAVTLTYGIFEQAYVNPGLRITINGTDRTVALGGPWNVAPGVLDITEYLRETSGEPLRGANTIVFTVTSSLLDIEATLKSVALPSNLLVAGL
jgi:hypothetical protein